MMKFNISWQCCSRYIYCDPLYPVYNAGECCRLVSEWWFIPDHNLLNSSQRSETFQNSNFIQLLIMISI